MFPSVSFPTVSDGFLVFSKVAVFFLTLLEKTSETSSTALPLAVAWGACRHLPVAIGSGRGACCALPVAIDRSEGDGSRRATGRGAVTVSGDW